MVWEEHDHDRLVFRHLQGRRRVIGEVAAEKTVPSLQPWHHVRDGAPWIFVAPLCALCWLVERGLGPWQQQFIKIDVLTSPYLPSEMGRNRRSTRDWWIWWRVTAVPEAAAPPATWFLFAATVRPRSRWPAPVVVGPMPAGVRFAGIWGGCGPAFTPWSTPAEIRLAGGRWRVWAVRPAAAATRAQGAVHGMSSGLSMPWAAFAPPRTLTRTRSGPVPVVCLRISAAGPTSRGCSRTIVFATGRGAGRFLVVGGDRAVCLLQLAAPSAGMGTQAARSSRAAGWPRRGSRTGPRLASRTRTGPGSAWQTTICGHRTPLLLPGGRRSSRRRRCLA